MEISGSPTEKAILSWAYKVSQMFIYSGPSLTYFSLWAIYLKKLLLQLGMKFDTIRSESAIIHAFPFNSEKKRGGVAVLRVIS